MQLPHPVRVQAKHSRNLLMERTRTSRHPQQNSGTPQVSGCSFLCQRGEMGTVTFSMPTSPRGVQRSSQAKHFQVERRDLCNLGAAPQDSPRPTPDSPSTRGQGIPQHFLHWQPPGSPCLLGWTNSSYFLKSQRVGIRIRREGTAQGFCSHLSVQTK